MKLVLVRHAKAVDRVKALLKGIQDKERPITKKGKLKFSEFVKENKSIFLKADLYASSEFLRAEQSLEVLLQALYEIKPEQVHSTKIKKITPDDLPQAFIKWISQQKIKSAVVISHEPFLSKFMQTVLGSKWKDEKIRKGTSIVLKYEYGVFKLIKVLHPKKSYL
jgi:phosphohistidine phosphatase